MLGTIRSFKPEVRAKMLAGIERTAKAVAAMSDAPAPDIRLVEGTKAVINDPAVVATAEKALKAAFGEKLRLTPANTTSEDFSEFAGAGVPSMMFNIGVYEVEKWEAANKSGTPLAGNHSPQFAPVPKPTLQTGITAMTLAVLSAFDQHAKGKVSQPVSKMIRPAGKRARLTDLRQSTRRAKSACTPLRSRRISGRKSAARKQRFV